MGFIKSLEELAGEVQTNAIFYDAEMLTVYFETKPEVVRRLLPPPLKPAKDPFGGAFIANYPRTSFGVTYLESALFLLAEYEGVEGVYCLAMPVTSDMALILGREVFGYPKKIANIYMNRDGGKVEGWTERHGARFFEVSARLTGKFNEEVLQQMMMERMSSPTSMDWVVYNFKYFPGPERTGFDYNPRLIREVVQMRPKSMEIGEAELTFRSSEHDFWGEVEIVRVLGAVYTVGDNTMLPGSVVAETDPIAFAPFAFMKVDDLRPK
jgi:Acetoacetate decarboxylase (ADC)